MKSLFKKSPSKNIPIDSSLREEFFSYSLDEPKFELTNDYRITIKGWLLPKKKSIKVHALRLKNNDKYFDLPYGSERRDVAQAYVDIDHEKALRSGFEADIEFENGSLDIEVDFGGGYEHLHKISLRYSGDTPLSADYNPHLASSWAEHVESLKDKSKYFHEKSIDKKFHTTDRDPRVVALYLPQFHPIPENDFAWGKGFTEWANVVTAQARFIGHEQPILPSDLGYYDLRIEEVIEDQVRLAKDHGFHGFCFYYYWFSGHKLLEKPLNSFLKHKEWDFKFMICWANENWTKRWDGFDNDVIVSQEYLPNDPIDFIKDVEHILLDPRYIRVDGKPVLAVYRPEKLDNPHRYTKVWRDYFKETHKLDLHLVSFIGFDNQDPSQLNLDASVDFVPLGIDFKAEHFEQNKAPQVDMRDRLLDVRFEGGVYDYRKVVLNDDFQNAKYQFKTYTCVMPSWDNEARKKGKGSAFYYVNPDLYGRWLNTALEQRSSQSDLVFVNAWNEWAEGAMLEPTVRYGHANLNRSAEVIAKHSVSKDRLKFPLYGFKRAKETELAVIVHLYYPDQWDYIREKLVSLEDIKFDIFISLQEKDKDFEVEIKKVYKKAYISIVPNRGRDILPFIHLARRLDEKGYKSILKLHTKKSLHRSDGSKWFKDLVNAVLPSKSIVHAAAKLVSNSNVFIGPKGHYVSLEEYVGSNKQRLNILLTTLYSSETAEKVFNDVGKYAYFGGSVFWASTSVLRPLLELYLMPEDFNVEAGQIDGTTAHAVERLLGIIAQYDKAHIYSINKAGIKKIDPGSATRSYKYAK